jgi:ubiquinone/menaquinone biosynthesis C-methylase UbiE
VSSPTSPPSAPSPRLALARAAPLLRLAGAAAAPEPTPDGVALHDAASGRVLRLEGGVLDLLGGGFRPSFTQRTLDTRATAWLYDRLRDRLTPLVGMPDFAAEERAVAERLALAPGDVVLDVACGHGNFTMELARRTGPEGLVIGLDISAAMLARAAARVRRAALANVLLIRGDAMALPFAGGAFPKLNCSGGLHQMPDLARVLAEMARVAAPGARLAASTFAQPGLELSGWRKLAWRRLALHFVPEQRLADALAAAGFTDVRTQMAGPVFAYAEASRRG